MWLNVQLLVTTMFPPQRFMEISLSSCTEEKPDISKELLHFYE